MSDLRIAVDAMGGDNAPKEVVAGAIQAAREHHLKIVLVGDQNLVRSELEKHKNVPSSLSIRHAGSVIRMDESATVSVRKKKDSSIAICADMAKDAEHPIRILCRPDCRGLCAKCGANLNSDKCDCKKTAS